MFRFHFRNWKLDSLHLFKSWICHWSARPRCSLVHSEHVKACFKSRAETEDLSSSEIICRTFIHRPEVKVTPTRHTLSHTTQRSWPYVKHITMEAPLTSPCKPIQSLTLSTCSHTLNWHCIDLTSLGPLTQGKAAQWHPSPSCGNGNTMAPITKLREWQQWHPITKPREWQQWHPITKLREWQQWHPINKLREWQQWHPITKLRDWQQWHPITKLLTPQKLYRPFLFLDHLIIPVFQNNDLRHSSFCCCLLWSNASLCHLPCRPHLELYREILTSPIYLSGGERPRWSIHSLPSLQQQLAPPLLPQCWINSNTSHLMPWYDYWTTTGYAQRSEPGALQGTEILIKTGTACMDLVHFQAGQCPWHMEVGKVMAGHRQHSVSKADRSRTSVGRCHLGACHPHSITSADARDQIRACRTWKQVGDLLLLWSVVMSYASRLLQKLSSCCLQCKLLLPSHKGFLTHNIDPPMLAKDCSIATRHALAEYCFVCYCFQANKTQLDSQVCLFVCFLADVEYLPHESDFSTSFWSSSPGSI